MDYGCIQAQTTSGYTVTEVKRQNIYVMSENVVLKQTFPVETNTSFEITTFKQRLGRDWPEYISTLTTDTRMVEKRKLLIEQLKGDASDRCFRFRLNA
jgi:hypothetical protein